MKRFLWVFLALFLFWAALGNFIFCAYRLRDSFNQVRQQLVSIASNAALYIDAQQLLEVPLRPEGDHTLAYQAISEKLEKIKHTNSSLKYVYIMMTTQEPGILQYVVDADPAPKVITARCPSALPGDKYDARAFPEMLEAYSGPAADKKITPDQWGGFISGYAPIYDASGKSIAILGVDTDAARIFMLQKSVRLSALLSLAAFFIFFLTLFGIINKG